MPADPEDDYDPFVHPSEAPPPEVYVQVSPPEDLADAGPPFPLNDLERKMMTAKDSASDLVDFGRALLRTEIWAIATRPVPAPEAMIGAKVPLMTTTLESGEPAVALFTAKERAVHAAEGEGYPFSALGREFFTKARTHKVWLNPASHWRVFFSPEAIEGLLASGELGKRRR
jgi:hypothetical protein